MLYTILTNRVYSLYIYAKRVLLAMVKPEDKELLKEMALEMGVPLYSRYSETESSEIIGVSPATLKRIRQSGSIAYIRVSERKIAFFGFQLLEYLLENMQCHNTQKGTSKSEITGSPKEETAPHGVERGSTTTLGKQDAVASAQRILKKPNKS